MREERPAEIIRLHLEVDKSDYYRLRAILVAEQRTVVSWVRERIREKIGSSKE